MEVGAFLCRIGAAVPRSFPNVWSELRGSESQQLFIERCSRALKRALHLGHERSTNSCVGLLPIFVFFVSSCD